ARRRPAGRGRQPRRERQDRRRPRSGRLGHRRMGDPEPRWSRTDDARDAAEQRRRPQRGGRRGRRVKLPRSNGSRIYLLHLLAVAVGLVLVVSGPWRAGIMVIGASFLV